MATPDAGTDGAQPLTNAVVQAEVLPSIEILPKQLNLAGRCNGSAFDLNTFINTTAQTSASVRVSSSAVNPSLLEQFTDNTGANVGVFNDDYPNFHILGFGGGLAPNTPITISIATYTGPNLTGTVTFTSTMTFNCSTGQISRLARDTAAADGRPGARLDRPGRAGYAARAGRSRRIAHPARRYAATPLTSSVRTSAPAVSSARRNILFEDGARSAAACGLAKRLPPRSELVGKRQRIGGTGRREHAGSVAGLAPERRHSGRRLPVEADQHELRRAATRERDFGKFRVADRCVGAARASAAHDAVPQTDPMRPQRGKPARVG